MSNLVLFELTLKLEHNSSFIIVLLITVANVIPQHQRAATLAAQALMEKAKRTNVNLLASETGHHAMSDPYC